MTCPDWTCTLDEVSKCCEEEVRVPGGGEGAGASGFREEEEVSKSEFFTMRRGKRREESRRRESVFGKEGFCQQERREEGKLLAKKK